MADRALVGLDRLVSQLRAKAAVVKDGNDKDVAVGYAAAYTLYVHEDLTKAHGEAFNVKHAAEIEAGTEHSRGTNQQAKFLERPARENRDQYAEIIVQALKQGKTLVQAMLLAGLKLQADSMAMAPVDKGNMRASAFTRVVPK